MCCMCTLGVRIQNLLILDNGSTFKTNPKLGHYYNVYGLSESSVYQKPNSSPSALHVINPLREDSSRSGWYRRIRIRMK